MCGDKGRGPFGTGLYAVSLGVQVLSEIYAWGGGDGKVELYVSPLGEFWRSSDPFGGQRRMRGAWQTWKQSVSE